MNILSYFGEEYMDEKGGQEWRPEELQHLRDRKKNRSL